MAGRSPLVSSVLEEAAALAGDDRWGDPGFVDALELLLRAWPHLTPFGQKVFRKVVLRHLRNRLYVQAYVADNPGVKDRPLTGSVVITGLPRTGTTVLHNLLALDPANRVLRLWEALHPVPPDPEGAFALPALVERAERWLAGVYELVPNFRAIHPGSASGPEECDALLQNEFASQHFDDMLDVEAYSSWLSQATLAREYSYYALQLRALSADGGRDRWVLKSPSHLGHLDTLLATLPDAVIVQCHRDPQRAVASYASLIRAVRSPYYPQLDPTVVGRQALLRSATAMSRAQEARRTADPGRFVDISYRSIVEHPIDAVRRLYERVGRDLDPGVEGAMNRWLAANPQHGHGVHRYDPSEFGVSAAEVGELFSAYMAEFGQSLR